jgi:hypothetical protein
MFYNILILNINLNNILSIPKNIFLLIIKLQCKDTILV